MQRISAVALCCTLIAIFAALAFTGKPAAILNRPNTAAAPPPAASRDMMFYWYLEPGDIYNDYNSLAGEEYEMWIYYDGVLINTSPAGATLIEEGYQSDAYPHVAFPYYYLYAHFDTSVR